MSDFLQKMGWNMSDFLQKMGWNMSDFLQKAYLCKIKQVSL